MIESESTAESSNERESAIHERLAKLLENEIAKCEGLLDKERDIDAKAPFDTGGLYHHRQTEINFLNQMIKILDEGKDRREIIHFLERKIENGQGTDEDRDDLNFLRSLEQEMDHRKAA